MRFIAKKFSLLFGLAIILAYISPLVVHASTLDELTGNATVTETQPASGSTKGSDNYGTDSITDYLKGYTPVTSENMASASTLASPIVNVIGTISGFIIMVVSAAIFAVTALDLAYIGLPFLRSILNPGYMAGGAAGGSPMGGMGMGGMGMGMRGGMGMGMGGMGGMGAMGGAGAQMPEHGLRRRWVSDEAVYCVNMAQSQSQPQGGAPMGGMGGMGMGMSMGMGGMGAMGGAGAQAAPMPMKSVILEYLKKRMFFLIVFSVCTVVLMSSIFTDCGINIGMLILKIFEKFSGQISQVSV